MCPVVWLNLNGGCVERGKATTALYPTLVAMIYSKSGQPIQKKRRKHCFHSDFCVTPLCDVCDIIAKCTSGPKP